MKRQRIIVVGTAACLFAGSMVSTAVGGPSISKLVKKEVAKQIAGMTGPQGAGGASGAPGQDAIAPAGAVMFFNLASCPSGWTELTSARGRYLVGRPSGGALAGTQGTALTNLENRAVGQHNHAVTDPGHQHNTAAQGVLNNNGTGATVLDIVLGPTSNSVVHSATTGITVNGAGSVSGTNAPYLQLTVCSKT